MINVAIILFAVSAVLGLTVLIKWLSKKDAPRGVVYSHGLAAASGLVILLVYAMQNPDSFPKVSIILFLISAAGGFYLFFTDLQKKPHPVAVALIHALLAVTGFVTLLAFAFL